mmetsp:Transcript_14026/g.18280  ORF Transcript_14026/g.18280 Transcript_14026/m.18280 type:complete len:80 (-) Transcript_14026:416-655(-)
MAQIIAIEPNPNKAVASGKMGSNVVVLVIAVVVVAAAAFSPTAAAAVTRDDGAEKAETGVNAATSEKGKDGTADNALCW